MQSQEHEICRAQCEWDWPCKAAEQWSHNDRLVILGFDYVVSGVRMERE